MRILGIDPGLQVCGYACLETDGVDRRLIEAGIFRSIGSLPIEERLNSIAEDMGSLLKRFEPEIAAVEELYSHYDHPKTSVLMAHARGVILQKCAEQGIKVESFSATRIKKNITGNGRASKGQIQRSVQTILGLADVPEPNDVSDAIAVSLCCADSIERSRV